MASLGNDLAYIRKEQELSLKDIHEATKIPVRILQSIEDGSIFTDFESNATYIRSYVRSYAKALSIDEKQIIYALDKAEKGSYSGSLQSLFTEKPKPSFEFDEEDKAPDEYDEHGATDEKSAESPTDTGADPQSTEETVNPPSTSSSAATTPPNVQSVDWADMGQRFQPLNSMSSRTWIGLSTIFVLAVAVGAFFYFYEPDTANTAQQANTNVSTPQEESSQQVSTDSLELNIVPSESTQDTLAQDEVQTPSEVESESLSALPDTLTMVVYAAYGRLEPVRIYTDIMDDINPYWIEQGEALQFNFVNEINLRGQTSRMVLLLNGHPLQNIREEFYNPDTRLLEIDRSYFENDSKWLEPAPDSLAIDAPPPSMIKERPTFN